MSSPDRSKTAGRFGRAAIAVALAALLAGCFEPLHGQRSMSGGPRVSEGLRGVDVAQIVAPNGTPEARIAVELRNALLFNLTGGSGSTSPTHRLVIQIATTRSQVIVDITTARPDVENYGINANYTLVDLATGRPVVTGQAFSRVSFDIPGQQQRFARQRGLRDAENRAAKVIADQLQARLASFFVTGA